MRRLFGSSHILKSGSCDSAEFFFGQDGWAQLGPGAAEREGAEAELLRVRLRVGGGWVNESVPQIRAVKPLLCLGLQNSILAPARFQTLVSSSLPKS